VVGAGATRVPGVICELLVLLHRPLCETTSLLQIRYWCAGHLDCQHPLNPHEALKHQPEGAPFCLVCGSRPAASLAGWEVCDGAGAGSRPIGGSVGVFLGGGG